jgi:hypothetical protein
MIEESQQFDERLDDSSFVTTYRSEFDRVFSIVFTRPDEPTTA